MPESQPGMRYRFGVFEADAETGELRRQGLRVELHQQPFALLVMLLRRPGEVLSREEISKELWPDGTFVDYEHGVNSAVNRLREALGDKASQPRYLETLSRRGYRFLAPVEQIGRAPVTVEPSAPEEPVDSGFLSSVLATPEDLPKTEPKQARTLFLLLQVMYMAFYVSALANLEEIEGLISVLPHANALFYLIVSTAVALIPLRAFLICGVLFRAPGMLQKYLRIWWFVFVVDLLWAVSPFLLLHHINWGLAFACTALLAYAPFAQRSLMLMGAVEQGLQ